MNNLLRGWLSKLCVCFYLSWTMHVPGFGKDFDVATNHWLVQTTHDGGEQLARRVARETGFTYIGPILGSKSEFHFIHAGIPHARSKRSLPHTRQLRAHPQVLLAHQQSGYMRVKRGYKDSHKLLSNNKKHLSLKAKPRIPEDPDFGKQWHLQNTGQSGGVKGLDLNVLEAWEMGYSGAGITTGIMDDGIDYLHEDLKYNYHADASYDFSSNDPYPYPRYTDSWFNSHGTRCAGEVSAARDNGVCGVGVAFGSKVAGLRMLDQPYMTDLIEANAMGHMPNVIDIYSASWGPTDDGKTVDGPRNLTMRAIVNGVNNLTIPSRTEQ